MFFVGRRYRLLNAAWGSANPMPIDLMPITVANLFGALTIARINKSANAISAINFQLFADVMR